MPTPSEIEKDTSMVLFCYPFDSCFGFLRNKEEGDPKVENPSFVKCLFQHHLLKCKQEEVENGTRNGEMQYDNGFSVMANINPKHSQNALPPTQHFKSSFAAFDEASCRKTPVKETHHVVRTEVQYSHIRFRSGLANTGKTTTTLCIIKPTITVNFLNITSRWYPSEEMFVSKSLQRTVHHSSLN
eukprot:Gb_24130 [translate_table: standard]